MRPKNSLTKTNEMATYYVAKIATSLIDSIARKQWRYYGEIRSFYKDAKSAISQADKMMKISESPEITYFVWVESRGHYVDVVWSRTGGEEEIYGMQERAMNPFLPDQLKLF